MSQAPTPPPAGPDPRRNTPELEEPPRIADAISAGRTLLAGVKEACAKFAERPALRFRKGQDFETLTYGQLWKRVGELALGLRAAGVTKDDRILIVAEDGPEAVMCELAAIANRAISVVTFANYTNEVIREIVAQTAPRLAIVESGKALARFLDARKDSAERLKIISFGDGVPGPRGEIRALNTLYMDGKRRMERSLAEGKGNPFEGLLERVRFEDPIAIAYSAGTTRMPRGALLTHANAAKGELHRLFGQIDPADVALVEIPLTQPFARLTACYGVLRAGAMLSFWPSSKDLFRAIEAIKPTMLFLAPGAIEPLEAEIKYRISLIPEFAQAVMDWALKVARRERAESHRRPGWFVERIVLGWIRARLGGRLRFVYVGGAADGNVLSFFQDLGVDTYEGYSLAEGTPVIALNRPEGNDVHRFAQGVVGKALPGIEVQIDDAGELRVKGLTNMRSYWRDDAASAATLLEGDWLRTGDIGYVNEHGLIVVEDRRADVLRLADGRYVAPGVVEAAMLRSPIVRQVCVIGRGRPYPIAIIVPDFKALAHAVHKTQPELAKKSTKRELMSNPASRLTMEIEVNERTKHLPEHARPKKIRLVSMVFSDAVELTPAGTMRRSAIEDRYAVQIEALYAERSGLPPRGAGEESGAVPVVGEETVEMRGLRKFLADDKK